MNHPSSNRPAELNELLQREERYDLPRLKVLGYPIWGLERFAYYERALAGRPPPALKGQGRQARVADASRKRRLQASVADLLSARGLSNRDIWVLSSTQYRRKVNDTDYRCMFTGHLEQQFGDRLLFLERNRLAIPPQQDPAVVYLDVLTEIAAGVAAQMAPWAARLIPKQTVQAFSPLSATRLAKAALVGYLFEALASSLFAICKPSAAFVLCGYTRFVPFQRVLRRAGVPVIELQHGIIHSGHAGYVQAEPVPDYLPDHVLVFGQRFGEILEQCSDYWRGRFSVGGHPWLAARAGQAAREAQARGPVVFFSQPIEPVSLLLRSFLPAFRRLLPKDIEVVLKPHPREPAPERDYAEAIAAGVRLAGREDDSYQLLANCRTSVCVFSTLALEALAFPCASVVLRSELWPAEIRQFVADGTLLSADSPEQLAQLVLGPQHRSRPQIAQSLFGLGAPPPDLSALIEQLRLSRV